MCKYANLCAEVRISASYYIIPAKILSLAFSKYYIDVAKNQEP